MSVLREILLGVDRDLLEEDGLDLNARCEHIVLLAQLHCLPSTVELFERLLRPDTGVRPSRTVIIPKPYSTIPSAIKKIREAGFCIVDQASDIRPGKYDDAVRRGIINGCLEAFRICRMLAQSDKRVRLVLVDDGGILTGTWWRLAHQTNKQARPEHRLDAAVLSKIDVISVQQTASGIRRKPDPTKLTKIDISRSTAKRLFESKIIAEGVLKKVRTLDLRSNIRSVGVVGVGALGTALTRDLLQRGFRVLVYDKQNLAYPVGAIACGSLRLLLREAEVVFGCTGSNFLRVDQLSHVRSKKPIHFISCSSRDVEFKNLLQLGKQGKTPFDRVPIKIADGQGHYIENGGFPINFDRLEEQEGPDEIALTRALVFTGTLQAIYLKKTRFYQDTLMLSPRAQQYIVDSWLNLTGSKPEQFGVAAADVARLNWWRENSGGCFAEGEKLPEASHRLHGALTPPLKHVYESGVGSRSWVIGLKRH